MPLTNASRRDDPGIEADKELLNSCTAFHQAHEAFVACGRRIDEDETALEAVSDRLEAALQAVLTSTLPTTVGGQAALAGVARVALMGLVSDEGPGGFEEEATQEHRVIAMALMSILGKSEG
jgi:hypothetical protein